MFESRSPSSPTQVDDGEEEAQCFLDEEGGVGAYGCFGDASSPRCEPKVWHTITCCVDAVEGSMHTYVDGREVAQCRSAKLCKDGIHSLKGRLAVFFARKRACWVDYYLRSVTIHNSSLDAGQVRKEHAMLHALLLEDAIRAVPPYMAPPLTSAHASLPFADVRAMREQAVAIKKSAIDRAEHLWQACPLLHSTLIIYGHNIL